MKKIVVLDLDREEFRFAVGEIRRRKETLIGAGAVSWQPTSEGAPLTPTEQANRIREHLKGYKLGKAPAILLVDRSKVEELNLELPPIPDAELPQMVLNQALLDSPGMSEETVIDFVPDQSTALETRRKIVALALAPKSIESYKSICQQAGLQLVGIQYRPYAATVPVRQTTAEILDTTSLVITLYREDVEFSILDGDAIPLSRQVRLPGTSIDAASLTRLLGEIRRTLLVAPQHLAEGRQIADIRLQANIESVEDLCLAIQNDAGLPVLRMDPLTSSGFTLNDGVELPTGSAALIGVLQQAANDKKPPIDFLNPRKPVVRKSNTRTLVLGAMLLAIAGYFGFDYLQQQYAKNNQGLNELRGTLADLKNWLKKNDKDRKLAEGLDQWERSSLNWLDEMRELSLRIPPGQDVTLSRVTMSPGRGTGGTISFSAAARTPDAVVALEKALRDERHAIQTPGITQRSDKNYPWGFESTLTVLKGAEKADEKETDETPPSKGEPVKTSPVKPAATKVVEGKEEQR